MSDEIASKGTLTADDIAALRLADNVCFYLHKGRYYVSANIELDRGGAPRIFTAREQRLFPMADSIDRSREIDVTGNVCAYSDEPRVYVNAFHMIHTAQYHDVWRTVVSLLTPGARLSLIWRADNNNGYLKEANLHKDELHVRIEGKRSLTIPVGWSVCPENSARMVKSY